MIHFGICGCGGFIEMAVLPMMRQVENAKPVAAFDVDRGCLERVCKEFDIGQACNTYEDLLKARGVDVIYVASRERVYLVACYAAFFSNFQYLAH